MDLILIISNSIVFFIWFIAGVILLLINTSPQMGARYRVAKCNMAIALFIGAFSIVLAFFFGKFHTGQIEILGIYSLMSIFLGMVFVLFSFISLYNSKTLSPRSMCWIFTPTLGLILLHGLAATLWGSVHVYSFGELLTMLPRYPILLLRGLILLAIIFGFVVSGYKYLVARSSYREALNGYFSGQEFLHTQWIDLFFVVFAACVVFALLSLVISSIYYDLFYSGLLTVVVIFYTVKFINYQHYFLQLLPAIQFADEASSTPYQRNDPAVAKMLQLWIERQDRPYLKSGLSLNDVSQQTGVSKRKLSEYINSQYGLTFNSWINTLRITEVERLLCADQLREKSLSEIAYQTGFADLAAMSNAFKKQKNISPSKYRLLLETCNGAENS